MRPPSGLEGDKMRTHICLGSAILGLWLAGCGGGGTEAVKTGEFDTSVAPDTTAPVIEHTPIERSQIINTAVQIEAVVTDEGGSEVDVVRLYHRVNTETEYTEQVMVPEDGGRYFGVIPADKVTGSKVFYYLWALDGAANEGFYPTPGRELDFGVTTE